MDGLRGREGSVREEKEWENEMGGEEGNRLDVGCVRVWLCGCSW